MKTNNFEAIDTFIEERELDGIRVLRVIKKPEIEKFDEPTFAKISNTNFHNGIIEVKVLSRTLPDAPDFARGFLGIAFRIDESQSKFEVIYIRPTNGRSDDQLRRNHSTQYFSYPNYKFDRLRRESDGVYESYADMGLDEWITMKIVVKNDKAQLYLNDSIHPVLIVNDLKLGADTVGGIGLWVETGTEGFFRDLKITHNS